MRVKDLVLPLLVGSLIFVAFGDRFLPAPLSTASTGTRAQLNGLLKGMLDGFLVYNRYHKTEDMIREAEKAESKKR
ncbi:hypothetical protein [Thermosynechococcus sp.]|uniref:hypothetical protein n=1 Tax=Thermosynechococcus sp. TaxID=2814275 RepID=UPI00391BBD51